VREVASPRQRAAAAKTASWRHSSSDSDSDGLAKKAKNAKAKKVKNAADKQAKAKNDFSNDTSFDSDTDDSARKVEKAVSGGLVIDFSSQLLLATKLYLVTACVCYLIKTRHKKISHRILVTGRAQ